MEAFEYWWCYLMPVWKRLRRTRWIRLARFLLGLFSPTAVVSLDFFSVVGEGIGATTLEWRYRPGADQERERVALMAAADEFIRRAPAPLGVDDFLMAVTLLGAHPDDRPEAGELASTLAGREPRSGILCDGHRLVALDRYQDWLHGDTQGQLDRLLKEMSPTPAYPILHIRLISYGAFLAQMVSEGAINLDRSARKGVARGWGYGQATGQRR